MSLFTKVCDVIEMRALCFGLLWLWGLCCGSGTKGVCIPGGFHHSLSCWSRCFWACLGALLGAVLNSVLIWPVVFVLRRGLLFGVMEALDGVCPLF